jgi:hypothetical protein
MPPAQPRPARGSERALRWVGYAPDLPGATCHTTCHPGKPSTNKQEGGSQRESLRRWYTICVYHYCVIRREEPQSPRQPYSTLHSPRERGARGLRDGAKHKKGSKLHAAVDTLGHLLALFVTPANEQERAWVAELAEALCNKRAANRWIWRTWIKATLGSGQRQEVQAHAIIS